MGEPWLLRMALVVVSIFVLLTLPEHRVNATTETRQAVGTEIRVVAGSMLLGSVYEFSPRPGVLCYGSDTRTGLIPSCVRWEAAYP